MTERPQPVITRISSRPIKGMRPVYHEATTTWMTGLAHDSEYFPAVMQNGEAVPLTRREAPGLARFSVAMSNIATTITSPSGEQLPIPHGQRPEGAPEKIELFEKGGVAAELSPEATGFLTDELEIGEKVRLMKMIGWRPVKETTQSEEPGAANLMAYQDGYPITIASEASLTALNELIKELGLEPATIDHFRNNLWVDTFYNENGESEAFVEDRAKEARLQSGESEIVLTIVRALARCAIIMQDPYTGENSFKHVMTALAKLHSGIDRTNGKRGAFFGMNLVHNRSATWIRVGDHLDVNLSDESYILR